MLVVTEEISVPLLAPLNKCSEHGKKKTAGGRESESEKENVAAVKA